MTSGERNRMDLEPRPVGPSLFDKVLFGAAIVACAGCFGIAAWTVAVTKPDPGIVSVSAHYAMQGPAARTAADVSGDRGPRDSR
jgi:hypothetical protein